MRSGDTERGDTEAGGTPEGHTPEKPAPSELGKLGTPGAGHAAAHPGGHDDEDERQEPLGPIDWRAWGAGAIGIAISILIALALALPTLSR